MPKIRNILQILQIHSCILVSEGFARGIYDRTTAIKNGGGDGGDEMLQLMLILLAN